MAHIQGNPYTRDRGVECGKTVESERKEIGEMEVLEGDEHPLFFPHNR